MTALDDDIDVEFPAGYDVKVSYIQCIKCEQVKHADASYFGNYGSMQYKRSLFGKRKKEV